MLDVSDPPALAHIIARSQCKKNRTLSGFGSGITPNTTNSSVHGVKLDENPGFRVYPTSALPQCFSSTRSGHLSGVTIAFTGMMNVCSVMNCPEMAAWGT